MKTTNKKINDNNLEEKIKEFLDNYNSCYISKKNGFYEIIYSKTNYDDRFNEESIKEILKGKTEEDRYNTFYEYIFDCMQDYENECIWDLTSEFESEYDYVSHDTEIQDILVNLINFNYDTYLQDTYNVNIIIDFNNQDSDTEFSNSSTLENCKNNNLYTLLKKQGYTKKDYLNNLKFLEENKENIKKDKYNFDYEKIKKLGGSVFLTSVYEEILNNMYKCLTTLVVLKEISLKELIENNTFNVNTNNMIGLFNECYGSGSLLEIQLEKDFILDREKDIFKIQIEYTKQDSGYTVNETYGLIGNCWRE